MDLVSSNPDHMVVSFTSGDLVLFNMETQQLLLKMEASRWPGERGGEGRRQEEGSRRVEERRGWVRRGEEKPINNDYYSFLQMLPVTSTKC